MIYLKTFYTVKFLQQVITTVLGQKNLSVNVKNAHVLISWVAGAVGLPNLLAQFYTYTWSRVSIDLLHSSIPIHGAGLV